jgi:hypothetical protein
LHAGCENGRIVDEGLIQHDNNVADLQIGLLGGRARLDPAHLGAVRRVPPELVGFRLGDIHHLGAEPAPALLRDDGTAHRSGKYTKQQPEAKHWQPSMRQLATMASV